MNNDVRNSKLPNWCKATTDTIVCYKAVLNNYLTSVDIPKDLLSCNGACSMSEHHNILDVYYNITAFERTILSEDHGTDRQTALIKAPVYGKVVTCRQR